MRDFLYHAKKVLSAIQDARHILVVTHQKPDGDAIGSASAMAGFLEKMGKTSIVFCPHEPQDMFHFLPHLHKFTTDGTVVHSSRHDLIIVLDSSDLAYAGIEELLRTRKEPLPPLVNIDHHASNVRFGEIHLIDSTAPSTTTILYHFFSAEHPYLIDAPIATALLTGLLTDTGHFSNPATNEVALAVGAELLKHGARFRQITAATWQRKEISTLHVWGKALARLQYHPRYHLAVTVLTLEDFRTARLEGDPTEGIANFLANLKEAEVILVLKEQEDGTIKGSLRTVHPDIDVSRLALAFGGGGHRKAAGFKVKGKLIRTPQGWKITNE
ncbi:MAG: bifunctional oligoribonuclease/PAP phosphatase NrnA [Patescibacteria group bacterium]